MTRALGLTLTLLAAAANAPAAGAAVPAFAPASVAAALAGCAEVARGRSAFRLVRTGDSLSAAALASRTMHGTLADGTQVVVVPFLNAAGAEHSALVFAVTPAGPREIGGFAATHDHLSISLGPTIEVSFFALPSHGRTLASGGPAPTSRSRIVVRENRLADASESPVSIVPSVPRSVAVEP